MAPRFLIFLHLFLLFTCLFVAQVSAADVYNYDDLISCASSSVDTICIVHGTMLFHTGVLNLGSAKTIQGANSDAVIELADHGDFLFYPSFTFTLQDIKFTGGITTAALITVLAPGVLSNFTNVIFEGLTGKSAISIKDSNIILKNVTFNDCMVSDSLIEITSTTQASINDLRFLRSSAGISLLSAVASTSNVAINLEGPLSIIDVYPRPSATSMSGVLLNTTGATLSLSAVGSPAVTVSNFTGRNLFTAASYNTIGTVDISVGSIDMTKGSSTSFLLSTRAWNIATYFETTLAVAQSINSDGYLLLDHGSNSQVSITAVNDIITRNIRSNSVGLGIITVRPDVTLVAGRATVTAGSTWTANNANVSMVQQMLFQEGTVYRQTLINVAGPVLVHGFNDIMCIFCGYNISLTSQASLMVMNNTNAPVIVNVGPSDKQAAYLKFTSSQNMEFSGNIASQGSVLNIVNMPDISLTSHNGDIVISDNQASGLGGAFFFFNASVVLDAPVGSIIFRRNQAARGGAIFTTGPLDMAYLTNVNVFYVDNAATNRGCAVDYSSPDCPDPSNFNRNRFTGNHWRNTTKIPECEIDQWCEAAPPLEVPAAPPTLPPVAPVAAPISAPIAAPIAPVTLPCLGSPPTANAPCIDGIWLVNATEVLEKIQESGGTIVIESPTVIQGNVTIPSVTIGNTFSRSPDVAFIKATGCIQIGTVTVVLNPEDVQSIEEAPRSAILVSSTCPIVSTSVQVSGSKPTRSCKQLRHKETNSSGTLSAVFSVDSSRCNTWWIILASVLGGVFLFVIVFVLLATFNPKVKAAVRPFWLRKNRATVFQD